MFSKILGKLLSSAVVQPLVSGAIDAYKSKLAAGNDRDRMAADLAAKELEVDRKRSELNTQLLIAEQGRWYTAIIRPLLALPVVIYLWKVIVWDKVLGLGVTDPITGDVGQWVGAIITTYVGGRTIEKVARIFKR